MEEARKIVGELNDELYGQGLEDISPFEYRSRGWQNSVITFMGETIWAEEDELREWIEEEDKFEDLYQFLWKGAKEILNRVSGAMDSEKVASEYLIRMLEAVSNSIDVKYEIDDYGVHLVEVSDGDYALGIIEDVFEERFPDQELLILTKESLNRVTKPIWENTKDEYTRGQEDLIARLKDEFTRILDDENNKGDMLLVEIIGMLRNLKAEEQSK